MIYPNQMMGTKDVSQHYNELDRIYRTVWGDHLHHGLWQEGKENKELAVEQLVSHIAKTAGIEAGHSVCDVGCGYGATSRMLTNRWNAKVVGVTVSEAQFAYINTHPTHSWGPEFHLMDWLKNDFSNESFDHVISVESSEHMPDKDRFFNEAWRVLKPGGTLLICAWLSKENPSEWEQQFLLEPICQEGQLPSMGSENDYRSFYQRAGFEFQSFEDLSLRVKKTWSLCIQGFLAHLLREPKDIQLLFPRMNTNASFAKSVFRIRLAYELGSMRYGMFLGTKR